MSLQIYCIIYVPAKAPFVTAPVHEPQVYFILDFLPYAQTYHTIRVHTSPASFVDACILVSMIFFQHSDASHNTFHRDAT